MSTLPHSIWLHVAQYLSPLFLRDLLTVNRTFFELAMDIRYRQLMFAYLDERMVKNLVRLKDPEVAKRVRIVHIDPSFIPLESSAHLCFTPSKPDCVIKHRSLRTILGDIANLLLEQRNSRHPKYRIMQSLKRRDDIVELLSEVLAGLPNVTDYYVSWTGSAPVGSTTTHRIPASFLTSPFQPNLRKLSLNISLHNVPSLLTPTSRIPQQLEELHLSLHSEHVGDEKEITHILQHHLAPAVSQLEASLKRLVISAWEPTDLSPLFDNLRHFPALDDLSINIPAQDCHLGDPAGLNGFLSRHQSTLRCLRLRPTQYGGKELNQDSSSSLHEWIKDATAGVNFTKLHVLDMTSSLFPVATSLVCLQRFARTLSSLSLTGAYRSYDDVAEAIQLSTHDSCASGRPGLLQLRIGLVSLCPELIDLIAEKLPNLQRLELLVKDIFPSIVGSRPSSPGDVQVPRRRQIEAFFSEMELRHYSSWKLECLAVLADMLPEKACYETSLEEVFFRCIPSLRSFTSPG
ncbi:hypothetical protein CC2G_012068 [Coprinopsis cinerea AmutBmut pab1-1]|nr:hypothetical protein CC2G_012068 [Coprinopsis cinerea AmutBmut pab1-1]